MKQLLIFFFALCVATPPLFAMEEFFKDFDYLEFYKERRPEKLVKYKRTLMSTVKSFLSHQGLTELVIDYVGEGVDPNDLLKDQILVSKIEKQLTELGRTESEKRRAKFYLIPYFTQGLAIAGMAYWLYKNNRAAK